MPCWLDWAFLRTEATATLHKQARGDGESEREREQERESKRERKKGKREWLKGTRRRRRRRTRIKPDMQMLHIIAVVPLVAQLLLYCLLLNRHRNLGDPVGVPVSHIDNVTKLDLNWAVSGWTASRCPGFCDDTTAFCTCGRGSK
jgi:hypothetical protein